MTTRYKVTTSAKDKEGNLVYKGTTYGIRFENGTATFDDLTIQASKKNLGYTADQIAFFMKNNFGYEVETYNEKTSKWETYIPPASEPPKTKKE